MWTTIYRGKLTHDREKAKQKNKTSIEQGDQEEEYIPAWFNKYIEYKFNLYDRAGRPSWLVNLVYNVNIVTAKISFLNVYTNE